MYILTTLEFPTQKWGEVSYNSRNDVTQTIGSKIQN